MTFLLCGVTLQFNKSHVHFISCIFHDTWHLECIQFYVYFIIINKKSIFLQIEPYKFAKLLMYLKYENSLKEDRDVPKIAKIGILSVLDRVPKRIISGCNTK